MKTKLLGGFVAVWLAAAGAQTTNLTALLQRGLFAEQATRDLDAAITDYTTLAAQFDKDRQLAATAVFRLGECYRAQGKTNEAAAHYQRILKDFSDQPTLLTLSRQNLAGMGAGKTETAAAATVENSDAQLWKKLEGKPQAELEKILPTLLPDATLELLLQQRNEAQTKRAALLVDYPVGNVNVVRLTTTLEELTKQLEEKISGMMQGLKLRSEISGSATAAAKKTAAPIATTDAEDKEIARIEKMIQDSPDLINAPESRLAGTIPLIYAASSGWVKVAGFLLDHGANVDQSHDWSGTDEGKISPLCAAVNSGNKAMTKFLIERGANVNFVTSKMGVTPLHLAARRSFLAVTETLLANHADVNAMDYGLAPPLFSAVQNGQLKIIEVLLKAGANLGITNNRGQSALNFAIKTSPEIQKALLDGGVNPNTEDEFGRTPLSYAVERDSTDAVKRLLAAKANPNGGKLDAPLMVAIHGQNLDAATLLLEAGAKPNEAKAVSWNIKVGNNVYTHNARITPLLLAVNDNQPAMMSLLLKFKADTDAVQLDQREVIFNALNNTNILEALLAAGASVDPVDKTQLNRTPLLSANKAEIISVLLRHKANPNAVNSEGNTALMAAAWSKNPDRVRVLLAGGANPDVMTKEGFPALLIAVADSKDKEVTALLLEAKANVNATDPQGKSALHWAAEMDRKDLVELLVKAGADVNLRAKDGRTPLDFAKSSSLSAPPVPGQPTARRFPRQPNNSVNQTTTNELTVVDFLRQNGALDALPDFTRIRITRQGLAQPLEVFTAGKFLTNRFTLLETVMKFYGQQQAWMNGPPTWQGLPFPDFGRVIIRRPSAKIGGKETEIKVSLLNRSNVVDCAQDVPVQFGDVIEIPEAVHALNAPTPNPVAEMERVFSMASIGKNFAVPVEGKAFSERLRAITGGNESVFRDAPLCLQKSVQLVVAGETTALKVDSWREGFLREALNKTEARSALRSSSDLSRVKVTRKSGTAGPPEIFTVDTAQASNNLWLQDGDVIEVPEK